MIDDLGPFWLSIRVASLATAAIVAVGLPAAWILARVRFPGRGLVAGVLALPLVLPPTVLGYVLLRLLGRRGWLGRWLMATWGVSVVFHWSGAVVASAVAAFPMFLMPARSAFEDVDPALEDAARLLGRGEASVFLRVTLPLAWRGLMAGSVLAFARSLGDFGATMMVAGDIPGLTQTASLAIYDAVMAEDPVRAAWLSTWIALTSVVAVGLAQRTLPGAGTGAMSVLEVRLNRRVHPGLTLDVAFRLDGGRGILFGPSGAGKSTVLRLIAGLERPDAGVVRLGDSVLFDSAGRVRVPLRDRRIGLIFQDDLLFPHLDVARNVGFGLSGWGRREAAARVDEVATLCGIVPLIRRRPATLSGGERQRVGLARAVAPRPRLLLCDEPVSALDLDSRHALLDRLRAVQEAEGIPFLYVTHAPDEAIALGTRLFRLEGGRIVAEGAPLDVLAAGSTGRWDSIRNVFAAVVEGHDAEGRETRARIVDGPSLIVPFLDRAVGDRIAIRVRSDDVVLALGPVGGLSARNLIAGTVDRVVRHGPDAEVVVRTGGVAWVVGVVGSAVDSLGLIAGTEVLMIVKARSCHVPRDDGDR